MAKILSIMPAIGWRVVYNDDSKELIGWALLDKESVDDSGEVFMEGIVLLPDNTFMLATRRGDFLRYEKIGESRDERIAKFNLNPQ